MYFTADLEQAKFRGPKVFREVCNVGVRENRAPKVDDVSFLPRAE